MKRVMVLLALVVVLLSGCVFSETDKGSLKEIVELYGGRVAMAKGTGTSGKYYEITITGSETPLQLGNSLTFAANNIAMIVYNGMDTAARNSYDEIRVVVKVNDVEVNRTVSVPLTKLMVDHAEKANAHKDALKLGQLEAIYSRFDTSIRYSYEVDSFMNDIASAFELVGDIEVVYTVGVDTFKHEGVDYIRYIDFYKGPDTLPNLLLTRSYLLESTDSIYGFFFNLRNPN